MQNKFGYRICLKEIIDIILHKIKIIIGIMHLSCQIKSIAGIIKNAVARLAEIMLKRVAFVQHSKHSK